MIIETTICLVCHSQVAYQTPLLSHALNLKACLRLQYVCRDVRGDGDCVAKRFLLHVTPSVLLEHSKVPGVWGEGSAVPRCGSGTTQTASEPVDETYIAEALQRTSKAIQDIDAVISAATLN